MIADSAGSRRRVVLGVLGALLTAACGGADGTVTSAPDASPSPSPSPAGRAAASPSPSPVASPSPAAITLGRPGLLAVEQEGRILLVDPEQQRPVRTLAVSPDQAMPRWSPDGRSVVVVNGLGPTAELRLLSPDGAPGRRLTANARPERGIVWSPRGDRLAYSLPRALGAGGLDDPAEPEEIWLLDIPSGADRKLADGFDPSWSPDGRRIVYATNGQRDQQGPHDNALRVIGEDGQDDRQLLAVADLPADLLAAFGLPFKPAAIRLRAPAWSPDGQRLVASADGHTSLAWMFDERGQGLKPLAPAFGGRVGRAWWSPDGVRLAIEVRPATAVGVVVVVVAASGRETTIGGPALGFQAAGPTWAPDGRRLALVVSGLPARRSAPAESALRLFGADGAAQGDLISAPDLRDPDWGRAP